MTAKNSSFADRLQSLREQTGLTKYALAKRTGLSKQGIAQLESGRSEPSWTTVQLLAAALDVDYAAFADPALTLPELEPSRPRGRPRKSDVEDATLAGNSKSKATTGKRKEKVD